MWTLGMTQWCLPGNNSYTLALSKAAGFDAVQLDFGSPEKGLALSHPELRRLYAEESARLGISLLPMAVNALCKCSMTVARQTSEGQMAADLIARALDAAADLGLEGVALPSFGASSIQSDADYARTVEMLRFACALAAERKLLVYTENVLSAAQVTQLFHDCAAEPLRLLFDSRNYAAHGDVDAVDVLSTHWDKIGSFLHVKDGDTRGSLPLGTGDSPFAAVMHLLRARHYSGTITIENNYYDASLCARPEDCFPAMARDQQVIRSAMQGA